MTLFLFEYNIYCDPLDSVNLKGGEIINTINPHSYFVAKKDKIFKKALKASDILLPDGVGIVFASKLLTGKRIEKIAGADIHLHLLKEANIKKLRVFYLGASEDTLDRIKLKLLEEYPNILVDSYSPPFKELFSDNDNERMIAKVNSFKPDILFLGMTAPKQEKWAYENQIKLKSVTICCIGAVFDFYSGSKKRSSNFWIDKGLEWLPRLAREPKRMFRRNFISTPVFIWDVLLNFLKKKLIN